MPTPTYTPIIETTLIANASTVLLPVPSGYKNLIVVINGTTAASGDIFYRINEDSGSNYPYVIMYGTGTSGSGGQGITTQGVLHYNGNTSDFNVIANFFDVSATNKHKTVLSRGNNTTGFVMAYGTKWANSSAITSLLLGANGTSFVTGTTIKLIGLEG